MGHFVTGKEKIHAFCIFSVALTTDGVSVSQGQRTEGASPQKAQIPILVLSSSKFLSHLLAPGGRTWRFRISVHRGFKPCVCWTV